MLSIRFPEPVPPLLAEGQVVELKGIGSIPNGKYRIVSVSEPDDIGCVTVEWRLAESVGERNLQNS